MTTGTLTLSGFLLARIAADEANEFGMDGWCGEWKCQPSDERMKAARARVLAECEAKRRIVELHNHDNSECFEIHRGTVAPDWPEGAGRTPGEPWAHPSLEEQVGPCPTLLALALPYADHPDYREEWRT